MSRLGSTCARFVAATSFVLAFDAHPQTQGGDPIPWAYGAYFGTGRYDLDDGETVYVLSARPSWRLRDPALAEDGSRVVGIEIRLPVAAGLYRFELSDANSTLRFDNVSTLSVVPGIEFDIPITPRWALKPIVYGGWGSELHGDMSAVIYWSGIRSQLRFHNDAFDWALVNGLTYVGYSSNSHRRARVLPLLTGAEFDRPLSTKKLRGEQVRLHWHVAYTNYIHEAEIQPAVETLAPVTLEDEWEIGAAFSTGDTPLRWWRFHWDRVGIAYRFSHDAGFKGIALTFRSLFDR